MPAISSRPRMRDRLKSILPKKSRPVSPNPSIVTALSSSAAQQSHTATTTLSGSISVPSSSAQTAIQLNPVASTLNSTIDPVPSSGASISVLASTPQQLPVGSQTASSLATTTSPSTNPTFLAALQKHIEKLPEVERQAFRQAHATISPDGLLARIRSLDTQHASTSSFRPHADKIAKFLSVLDRLLGGVAIAIQANPDISSIAVGGVKLIVDVAMGFTKFFGKLTDMFDQLSDIIGPLERYAERIELSIVRDALANVYGDILDFYRASTALFIDRDGQSKLHATFEMFLHSQWKPFETEFGEIDSRMDHHRRVLLEAAQAELLSTQGLKERENFLRWLSPYSFQPKQNLTLRTKHQGTGDWLLQTREFLQWVNARSSQLLWCYGKPGAGKSVLASHVINHIQHNYVGERTGSCFAYFSFTDPTFQDLALLIALFLKQLCQKHGVIPGELIAAKREAKEPADVLDTDSFLDIARLYERVFIVIDGLDECPEEKRSPILDFIVKASSNSKSNIKIFVSSRKEYDISARFKYLNIPAIELETGKLTPDIQSFVRHEAVRLRTESRLCVRDDRLFAEIIQKLVDKSDGMFLWVNLQLEQLCRISRGDDVEELKQALDRLPRGLDATYTRILNDIAGSDKLTRKIALESFRWLMYAEGQLSVEVLQIAVALLKSPRTARELMLRRPSSEYIQEECRNLVQLSQGFTSEVMMPAHLSFLEYLQDLPTNELQGEFWNSLADSRESHSLLACRCVDWLLLKLPDNWTSSDTWASYEELRYPTKFFDRHAVYSISRSLEAPANLLSSISQLLNTDSGKLASLVKLRLMRTPLGKAKGGRDFDEALSRNYLMWTSDIYRLPGLSNEWTELEVPRHALHLAVWFRPGEVQRLISNGHHVDELDVCQRTPLSYACTKGCLTSVGLLLRAGATLEADSWQKSPLGLAIQYDHFKLTKTLLAADANICARSDDHGRVPLMMATSLRMVQLLCEKHDFDLNATDCVGRSILGYYVGVGAIRFLGNEEATQILEYLINLGADMYAKSKAGMNLVDYAACRFDSTQPLKFLLQRDAQLIMKEAHEWAPLHWACRQGNFKMAMMLLEYGATAKSITTLQPPRSWTPYEILIHYGEVLWGFNEPTRLALGQSKENRIIANLYSEEQIKYGSLKAIELSRDIDCSLCTMQVQTGFLFGCETCASNACLMCNHTLHNDQADHDLRVSYIFKAAHTCGPTFVRLYYEVKLPCAINLQLPGWQRWLKETDARLRNRHHEELREKAVRRVLDPHWTYELTIDDCDGSY